MGKRARDVDGPPMEFDGEIYWYKRWFDPSEDLCCAPSCRKPIGEDEVPLILFKGEGQAMQQSRIHFACAEALGIFRRLVKP